jgi:hypothetical protein
MPSESIEELPLIAAAMNFATAIAASAAMAPKITKRLPLIALCIPRPAQVVTVRFARDNAGMMRLWFIALSILICSHALAGDDPLATGVAGHAFDHLGNIGDQADAAVASGQNIIYSGGIGGLGYAGLPPAAQLDEAEKNAAAYLKKAKASGVRLAIGYVCATSIVKLDTFDKNWPAELRSQLKTPPSQWLQRDKNGQPLPSWYGGDYRPACMNNPDWRTYEKYIVQQQLEAGFDGIFFDNPTVHPDGCYCDFCMTKFRKFAGTKIPDDIAAIRQYAQQHKDEFLRFRSTIASDFLKEMRAYARTINPKALITCNNSLNSPEQFFSQCRVYGYDIDELSKVEDLVVIEDMATQPRVLPDGKVVEYGPVYEMLHAISHDKPIVAVVIADGDYHTPPSLMRLAMAEAAAHGASYLSWPTWPENERKRMSDAVRPEAEFLREHADLLNDTKRRDDAAVYLPFENWVQTADCAELGIARQLSAANVQFSVFTDDTRAKVAANLPIILAPQNDPTRLASIKKSIELPDGPPTVRAVLREKAGKTIVHLLNLNVQRISSFEDRVTPASDVRVRLRCATKPKTITALSADESATRGAVKFKSAGDDEIEFVIPRIDISTILVVE